MPPVGRTQGISRRVPAAGIEYAAVVAGREEAQRLVGLWPECDPANPAWDLIPLEAELGFYEQLIAECGDAHAPFRAGAGIAFGPHRAELERLVRLFGLPVRTFAALPPFVMLLYPRLRTHLLDATPEAVVLRLAPTALLQPVNRCLFVCGLLAALPLLLGAGETRIRPVALPQEAGDVPREPLALRGPGDAVAAFDGRDASSGGSPVVVEIRWSGLSPDPPAAIDAPDTGQELDAALATWFFDAERERPLRPSFYRAGRFLQAEARRDLTAGSSGTLPGDARWRRVYRYALARVGQELGVAGMTRDLALDTEELHDFARRFYNDDADTWLRRLTRGVALDLLQRTDLSEEAVGQLTRLTVEETRALVASRA